VWFLFATHGIAPESNFPAIAPYFDINSEISIHNKSLSPDTNNETRTGVGYGKDSHCYQFLINSIECAHRNPPLVHKYHRLSFYQPK